MIDPLKVTRALGFRMYYLQTIGDVGGPVVVASRGGVIRTYRTRFISLAATWLLDDLYGSDA